MENNKITELEERKAEIATEIEEWINEDVIEGATRKDDKKLNEKTKERKREFVEEFIETAKGQLDTYSSTIKSTKGDNKNLLRKANEKAKKLLGKLKTKKQVELEQNEELERIKEIIIESESINQEVDKLRRQLDWLNKITGQQSEQEQVIQLENQLENLQIKQEKQLNQTEVPPKN